MHGPRVQDLSAPLFCIVSEKSLLFLAPGLPDLSALAMIDSQFRFFSPRRKFC